MRVALRTALLLLVFGTMLSAGLISGVAINSFSGETYEDVWDMRAIHLVDGSGLIGGVHGSCYENGNCWQNGFWGGLPAWVVFDLNGVYTVDSMHVWSGYWANFESARSPNEVVISTSLNLADWVGRGTFQFPMAPDTATSYTGFEFGSLGWGSTRYIRFNINSNYGGGSCSGCVTMAEVQFSGGAGAEEVPEPKTITLVAAGALLSWWRRRVSRRRPAA
jgi:hypothetical protein